MHWTNWICKAFHQIRNVRHWWCWVICFGLSSPNIASLSCHLREWGKWSPGFIRGFLIVYDFRIRNISWWSLTRWVMWMLLIPRLIQEEYSVGHLCAIFCIFERIFCHATQSEIGTYFWFLVWLPRMSIVVCKINVRDIWAKEILNNCLCLRLCVFWPWSDNVIVSSDIV